MRTRRIHRRAVASAVLETFEPRYLLSATPAVIDLLAVYTPAAASAHGGGVGITNQIQGSVDAMNRALINSEISITIRLVHAEQITYTGSNDLFLDRQRLELPADGYMDSVHALRNTWGADLVTLITDGATIGGGNANLMTNIASPNNPNLVFSAIAANSIGPLNLTLAHELGHNLGGGHERGNPTQPAVGPFPYSVGYRYTVNDAEHNNVSFNDIMSYSYGPDIGVPYFANPNVTVEGAPIGKPASNPNEADIAATFAQTASIVANYRTTNVVPDTAAPLAVLYEIDRTGSSLTFSVRYGDDSGIDLSTIDSSDIIVGGPGGWALPATFISTDHPDVAGAFKRATYRVTLPATNPTTESLTFSMRPNAVRDLSNHYAASGTLSLNTAHDAGWNYSWAQNLGNLAVNSTRTVFGALDSDYARHKYKFTLASTQTVGAAITGVTGDAHLYILQDKNLDSVFQNSGNFGDITHEVLRQSTNFGVTTEGLAITLPAGTYYIMVDRITSTPYTLTLRAYTDTTPPTATLHATDLKTTGASHVIFAVTYTDDFDLDGDPARYKSALDIHFQADLGWTADWVYYPDSAPPWGLGLNEPTSWANEKTKTIYYTIPAFNATTGWTSTENGTWTVGIHPSTDVALPRVRDGAGNDIAIVTLGSFRTSIGESDGVAPTASLLPGSPVPGLTTWDFQVAYKDNVAINSTTIDGNDIRVTGPGGFNQLAALVSLSAAPIVGSQRIATYRVNAPGGFWDGTDDGTYTVALQASQVADTATPANIAAAVTLGNIATSMPSVVAQAGAVAFNGTNSPELLRLDRDSSFTYFNLNDTMLWYIPNALVPRAVINGLDGNDTIYMQSGALTGAVNGGSGTNTLNVTGGSLTLDTDAANAINANVGAGATLQFTAKQHLTDLNISGTATLTAGGAKVIVTPSLNITGVGRLDLNDNKLILNYSDTSPVGSWNGASYSDLTGLIASGQNGGAWNGNGLTTSMPDAASGLTTLGIGEAADILGLGGSNTMLFSGETVDATCVLIKYTYTGDANLDGIIDGTDYFYIDSNVGTAAYGYANGDFNYDGIVDGTDYFYIDSNIVNQGVPLSAAGGFNYAGFIDETDYAHIDFGANEPGAFAYFNGDFNDDGVIDGTDYFYNDGNTANQGPPL